MSKTVKAALMLGGVLFTLSIVLGALGAHALKSTLDSDQLASFLTAVRYQQFQGIGLVLLALVFHMFPIRATRWILWSVVVGTVLFSGSIYALVFSPDMSEGLRSLVGPITPIGGLLMILGWALFVWSVAMQKVSNQH